MRLRYRGKQIAALEKKQAKLAKKIAELKRTSRAFKTKDEYLLWAAQFL